MNLNQFTIKAQEVVQKALQLANDSGNQAVETGHVLKASLDEGEGVVSLLLKKLNVNVSRVSSVVDNIIASYPKVSGGDTYFSKYLSKALQKAITLSKDAGDQFVSVEYLLAGLIDAGDDISQLLKDNGVSLKELQKAINELRKGSKVNSQTAEDTFDALNRYAINLNDQARNGKLDPVIGREEEIRRVLQILSRRTKNNPILIGEPGVGKTAIAEGLAHRIINGDVPENLKTKQVFSLDMGALVAGAKYKGEFEERLKAVVKEVITSDGDVVLFIDEIHTLVGAGRSDGAMDAANILKPALARGELRAIGATTINEYQKYFEKDKALERRFQTVLIDEPDTLNAVSILRGIKERYETHHQVRIRDEAVIAAVELSQRYISDRFLPDKAIDLMDEAAAKLRLEMNSVPEEIDLLERRIQQLEIEREAIKREGNDSKVSLLSEEIANIREKCNGLRAKWQSERDLIKRIQGIMKDIENFKIEAQQAERQGDYGRVAELRYGKIKEAESAMKAYNMELQEQQSGKALIQEEVTSDDIAETVARWTGIPVSRMLQSEREKLLTLEAELHRRVIGQDEAIAVISDAVRRNRAGLSDPKRPIGSFVFLGSTGVGKTELARTLAEFLFNDENMMTRIDMSEYQESHSVSRLVGAPPGYVGYDEGGQLTESVRHKPYSVVLLDEIEKAHPDVFNILLQVLDDGRLTDNKGRTVNFKNTIIIMTSNIGSHLIMEKLDGLNNANRDVVLEDTRLEVMNLLKQTIRPEFINRVDEIVVFKPLMENEIKEVVRLQINHLQEVLKTQGIELHVSDSAIEWLAIAGYDPQFGARPVKRVIQKNILNEMSKRILSGRVQTDKPVKIDNANGQLAFEN